jgi:hypothetical protein
MEREDRDALKLWKSLMTGGVYSLSFRKLSIGFLRGPELAALNPKADRTSRIELHGATRPGIQPPRSAALSYKACESPWMIVDQTDTLCTPKSAHATFLQSQDLQRLQLREDP